MEFRKDNYINIQGWMITDLKLKGNELIVFAVIYGFSQDGSSTYSGGLKYLAEATNATVRSIINITAKLVDEGLITKIEKKVNGTITYDYRWSGIKKQKSPDETEEVKIYTEEGSEKSSRGVVKKIHGGGEEISPHLRKEEERSKEEDKEYIINNNINPLYIPPKGNEQPENQTEQLFSQFWKAYPKKVNKPLALKSFKRLNPSEKLLAVILEAVEKAKKSKSWQGNNGQFIPHPSSYLNGRRWEDQIEVNASSGFVNYEDEELLEV